MKGLLCRVLGHRKALVPLTSNRFSCRRCGLDLGREEAVRPQLPEIITTPSESPDTGRSHSTAQARASLLGVSSQGSLPSAGRYGRFSRRGDRRTPSRLLPP